MSRKIRLSTRYYRALPVDPPGDENEVFELRVEQTALVGMHCWNIGCADGLAVDIDFRVGWSPLNENQGVVPHPVRRTERIPLFLLPTHRQVTGLGPNGKSRKRIGFPLSSRTNTPLTIPAV